jgi:hypothetical protein
MALLPLHLSLLCPGRFESMRLIHFLHRFYYGDERKPDGAPGFQIDGDAHGKLYLELAEGKEQGPWQQTFVTGVGYKNFA